MFRALVAVSVIIAVLVAIIFGKKLAGKQVTTSPRMSRYPLIEALIAFVMWCSLIVLAGTAFLGATLTGSALRGFPLLIHTVCGAMFAVSFSMLAVFRAETCKLDEVDSFGRFSMAQKICFWVIGFCCLGLISSVLIAMFPLLGTEGQHMALRVHKLSALVALIAAIIYAGVSSKRG